MAYFAVLDGENVINTIVADSKEIAEEITGKTCVEFTTEPAECGGLYINNMFIKRKPYSSWVLNSANEWVAPIPYPEIDENNPKPYGWDEQTTSWVEVE
jgi:hypothetical protein